MNILNASKKNIILASQIVRKGGLVVFPTETVYGLGCDPQNPKALEKIFRIKKNRNKPLPILITNILDAEKIAIISKSAKLLAKNFWPGPLTMILSKKAIPSNNVTSGRDSVGLRIPDNKTALDLINLSGGFF